MMYYFDHLKSVLYTYTGVNSSIVYAIHPKLSSELTSTIHIEIFAVVDKGNDQFSNIHYRTTATLYLIGYRRFAMTQSCKKHELVDGMRRSVIFGSLKQS